jgi:hypothetical protein
VAKPLGRLVKKWELGEIISTLPSSSIEHKYQPWTVKQLTRCDACTTTHMHREESSHTQPCCRPKEGV